MDAFMNLEVLGTSENFATSRKRTWERLLTRMHANMIDQLVFGFERFAFASTILPKARMISNLGPTHMFDSDVCDNFM